MDDDDDLSSFPKDPQAQESPPSPIKFANDGEESVRDDKDSVDDADVQELMSTYEVISTFEAHTSRGVLDSRDLRAMLKKFRRMPALAKRMLVLSRTK